MACRRCSCHIKRGGGEGVYIQDEGTGGEVLYKLCEGCYKEFRKANVATLKEFDVWRARSNTRSSMKRR